MYRNGVNNTESDLAESPSRKWAQKIRLYRAVIKFSPTDMAEGRRVKQVLEKEVTCPLCLDIFKEPKKLPCDHVYCRQCIEKLANRSLDAFLSCPECRTATEVPNGEVTNFSTAYLFNRLVEAFQRVDLEVKQDSNSVSAAQEARCKDHDTEQLVLYCETCQMLLCRDCVIVTREHADHQYGFVKEMRVKLQEKLLSMALGVESHHQSLLIAHNYLDQVESDFTVCKRLCVQEIERAFGALYRVLQESEKAMKKNLAQQLKSSSTSFTEKKKELESIQGEISTIVEIARQSEQEDDVAFLTHQSSIQQRLELVQEKLNKTPLSVSDSPQFIRLKVMADDELKKQLDNHSGMCAFDPTKWQFFGSFLSNAEVGKQYTLTIENRGIKVRRSGLGQNSRIVTSKFEIVLVCTRDDFVVLNKVVENFQDRFTINIKLKAQGRYKLSIKVNNMHIDNSPLSFFVRSFLKHCSFPVAQIPQLKHPGGLCNFEGDVLVSEIGANRVLKSHLGTTSILFELDGVNGLAASVQSIAVYATTTDSHQVHKFTKSGSKIKTIGDHGNLPGQFDNPSGLRVSQQDELYVCDGENSRIQILDLDLNFKRSFGTAGTRKGQFSFPSDIDFDASGKIYVVDSRNHRIQVFTPNDQFLFVVGGQYNKPFITPVSLAIHKELLYITEYDGHRVSVMSTSGEMVTKFGDGHLLKPERITVDEDGYIYVTI